MRLRTIWTIPGMAFLERLRRSVDTLTMSLAYRLPTRLRFWVTLHSINYVAAKTGGVVGAITVDELMRHLPTPKDLVR